MIGIIYLGSIPWTICSYCRLSRAADELRAAVSRPKPPPWRRPLLPIL